MKKSLALIAAVAALALPMSAQAHRAWLAPTSTVLSGADAWVGFDAGMSNGVFIPDHAAMNTPFDMPASKPTQASVPDSTVEVGTSQARWAWADIGRARTARIPRTGAARRASGFFMAGFL